ncbi:MAG: ArsR/SmtB family transcription factor [Cyanobacteriota bacterium]
MAAPWIAFPKTRAMPTPPECGYGHNSLVSMASLQAMPSPQLLEEYCNFFRLLSEPARLQLLCLLKETPMDVASLIEATGFSQSHISRQLGQLQRGGLVRCEREGVRLTYHADSALVDDLCQLVQNRLRERLETQLQTLAGG